MEHKHQYVFGKKVILRTDQKALINFTKVRVNAPPNS